MSCVYQYHRKKKTYMRYFCIMTEIKFTKQTLLKEEWSVRKVQIRMNILTSLPKMFEVKVNIKTE